MSHESEIRQARLESIIADYLESLDSGSAPDEGTVISNHPDLAEELREFFQNQADIEFLARRTLRPEESNGIDIDEPTLITGDARSLDSTSLNVTQLHAKRPTGSVRGGQFGDYELISEIARGGMGVVYKARQRKLDRIVALKMILAGQLASEDDILRFYREAEAAANLDHPGIVPIIEVGEHEGQHFFSMGYVNGPSLAQVVANGPLPARTAAEVVKQVADAIAFAHDNGVIHRDLKPANILMARCENPGEESVSHVTLDGSKRDSVHEGHYQVRVTDFGLAKKTEGGNELTGTGQILGTPSFMPPEQASGEMLTIDATADVYSLGAILYCLLTGRPPFQAASVIDTLLQVMEQEPISPRHLNPDVPRDLETICLKCLHKDRRKRYQSAREFTDELGRYGRGEPIDARPIGKVERSWRWCRRNPSQAILTTSIGLLLILLAGGALYSAYLSDRHAEELEIENQRAYKAEKSAKKATRVATNALYESHVGRARAERWSGHPGQYFASLDALKDAARILPSLEISIEDHKKQKRELRNEAVAAMPLVDLRVKKTWHVNPGETAEVTFSQDYTTYAQGDVNGNVTIRRVRDNAVVERLKGPGSRLSPSFLRFSPDGQYLAAEFYGPRVPSLVWIWNVRSGMALIRASSKTGLSAPVAFAAHNRVLVMGRDNSLRLYSLQTGKLAWSRKFSAPVTGLCVNPDRDRVALSSEIGVDLLNIPHPSGFPVSNSSIAIDKIELGRSLTSIIWTRTYFIAGTHGGNIYVWPASQLDARPLIMDGHVGRVVQLRANNKANLLLSRSWDKTHRLWDLQRGREVLVMNYHKPINSPFSPNDRWIGLIDSPSQFSIYELAHRQRFRTLGDLFNTPKRWMTQFHPSLHDLLAVATSEGVEIWNVRTGAKLRGLKCDVTQAVLFTPDGKFLLTSGAMGFNRWPIEVSANGNIDFGDRDNLLPNKSGRASLDKSGRYAAVDYGRDHAMLVDLKMPGNSKILGPHHMLDRAVISPDGRLVVTATWQGRGVWIWDRARGRVLKILMENVGNATPAFSPDGKWLAIATGEMDSVWETTDWTCRHRIRREKPDGFPGDIAFSPDCQQVVFSDSRYSSRIVNVDTGECLAYLDPPERRPLGWRTFSKDGAELIITESKHIQIWNWNLISRQLKEMHLD